MDSTILKINKTSPKLIISGFTEGIIQAVDDPTLKIITGTSKLVIQQETVRFLSVGVQGPAGVDGDANYVHNQILADDTWHVHHNLGKRPSVTVVDSGDTVVVGEIEYINNNRLRVTFSAPFGGKAYIN